MLYGGSKHAGGGDSFKTAVIDTIVAEVQNVPGDDCCVLLLGYKEQMEDMFQVCILIYCNSSPHFNLIIFFSTECEPWPSKVIFY